MSFWHFIITKWLLQRESEEGKLNAVSLKLLVHGSSFGSGSSSEEETINEMKSVVGAKRRELLRLVSKGKDSIVPKPCKDLFWKMSEYQRQLRRDNIWRRCQTCSFRPLVSCVRQHQLEKAAASPTSYSPSSVFLTVTTPETDAGNRIEQNGKELKRSRSLCHWGDKQEKSKPTSLWIGGVRVLRSLSL